jgi:hypothetical protein
MNKNAELQTCTRCGTAGLVWAQSIKGKWYLGVPHYHNFADGGSIITHIAGHNCKPTAEGLALMEQMRQEKAAKAAAEAERQEALQAELAKLRHVDAEIGSKIELTGVVTMATTIETGYGPSRIIVIKTNDYQVAKMFTTAEWSWGVNFDDVITIKGTVDTHDEYKGQPQTKIKRPSLVN